ncbi:MAG: class I SAM-dependent methyltransferase [Gammaproteobacteria bacterium]|nr:class I SAM-dependent methyltransferase [Gammaproteobacteria bacterium]
MIEDKVQPALAGMTFNYIGRFTRIYKQLSLPVISTGRSFEYYRRIFFGNKSSSAVLRKLQGQCVLDVGCGLTPYVSNSMFQACYSSGVDFYGIDPKLAEGFKLGRFDRAKIMATGRGKMNHDAPGLDKGIATVADDLPFADESVDLILSSYLLFAWIDDEDILEAIFREFDRVLKPGGKVKIFPAPAYDAGKIRHQGLRQIIEAFEIDQAFLTRILHRTQFPPAYMRTMLKQP